MDDLPIVKIAPLYSFPAGSLTEEEAAEVRAQHEERVEEWLDECDFLTELFALHAKYGIEKSEEGYAAYRTYLRLNYNTKIAILGPRADPVGEGCDCIFCGLHEPDAPVEEGAMPASYAKPKPQPKPPVRPVDCREEKADSQKKNPHRSTPAPRRRPPPEFEGIVVGEKSQQSCGAIATLAKVKVADKKSWDLSRPTCKPLATAATPVAGCSAAIAIGSTLDRGPPKKNRPPNRRVGCANHCVEST
ncbi:MAG: hypothetical protein NXI22_02730 [bacterium]|nr:hypothetical protein [bacterium]